MTPEQLIADFERIKSLKKLKEYYNISFVTLYSAFEIIGYDCKRNTNLPDITKEYLEELYCKLGTLKQVARFLNCDPGTVKNKMISFGLEYKPQVRHTCDHDFFSRDNEESFYLAGFIAADGCVKSHKNKETNILYIGLSSKDEEFLIKLRDTMKSDAKVRKYIVKQSNRNKKWKDTEKSELVITSKKMCDDLLRFNITERKTLTYIFPEWLKTHPLKHHFIRGYNDGDGSFHTPKLSGNRTVKQLFFSLRGTTSFLKECREVLEKECELENRTKDIRISSNCGVLEYGGNGVLKKIVDFLYKDATIYLDRKYDIVKSIFTESYC